MADSLVRKTGSLPVSRHFCKVRIVIIISVAAWLISSRAEAAKATAQVAFDSRSLAATLWVPDRVQVLRGVLVITGGQADNDRSGDTRGLTDSRFYQRVAESFGFALLGNQFRGAYTDAANGPGQALLDALSALATKTKHPELERVPLLMHGFSNGGFFGFTFAQWKPERTIAFCLNKSGFAKAPLDAAFLAVPGLLVYGELEIARGMPSVIAGLVREGRKRGALWAETREWGRGHEEGEVERVVVPFFAAMVEARLPKDATGLETDVKLNVLSETEGWLADHSLASLESELPAIARFADYTGDRAAASWLPNEAIANLWRGFVAKRPLALVTPRANAQLEAAQVVQLTAAGTAEGETVTFYDGARALHAVPVRWGRARVRYRPDRVGVVGLVALAGQGKATRTSRPVAVVVYGRVSR